MTSKEFARTPELGAADKTRVSEELEGRAGPVRSSKATKITLRDFSSAPMRAFHMTWLAFFLCFFGWFGIAPLMPIIRDELHLTKEQIGNSIIASVAFTIFARLVVGWLCDRIGPRRAYTWLLILGSLPVMGVGFAHDYSSFLFFRLAIGAIGASFVITQYHSSSMFAPNVVGTSNAMIAGWGNLGGGFTQMAMPMLFGAFLSFGVTSYWSWRVAMIVPGIAMLLTAIAYHRLTQDTPEGNFKELRAQGKLPSRTLANGAFWEACKDRRVWALALLYGTCFGVELTMNNVAALYFTDYFGLSLKAAGFVAATYGLMDIFARWMGGALSDRLNLRWGLRARVQLLACMIAAEGLALMLFSQATWLPLAVGGIMMVALFVKMSNGATFSIVPFVNKRAVGAVAGIVGAGGNLGSVLAGMLFKSSNITWPQAFFILGAVVTVSASLAFLVRFSERDEPVPAHAETPVLTTA